MFSPAKPSNDSDDESGQQYQFKVLVLGDTSVGKTSLSHGFVDSKIGPRGKTVGVDFFIKRLNLPDGVRVSIQLWDVQGRDGGGNMLSKYVYGAQAIVFVYDITELKTFERVEHWLSVVHELCGDRSMPYLALVANKTDLLHLRGVRGDQHEELALKHNMYSYFVSAATGDGVPAMIYRLAADLAGIPLTAADIMAAAGMPREQPINGLTSMSETRPRSGTPDSMQRLAFEPSASSVGMSSVGGGIGGGSAVLSALGSLQQQQQQHKKRNAVGFGGSSGSGYGAALIPSRYTPSPTPMLVPEQEWDMERRTQPNIGIERPAKNRTCCCCG